MFSSGFPESDQVLDDLGAPFIEAFIDAVDGARGDYADFKQWRPNWFPGFTGRFTANFLHERIWDRLVHGVDGMDGIHVTDQEPVRQVRSGTTYLIRIKRHRQGDRIATYPTKTALAYWSNSFVTFEGLESFSLALGYYWDADLRAMGDAILSFRDGKDNPIWAVQLRRDGGSATGFTWTPVAPDLPEIDLSGFLREDEEEAGS